jgi:hypothetical protein
MRAVPLLALALAACGTAPPATSDEGLERIAKGSPEAIAEAVAALPDADGHAGESLLDALARAMQVAPERVLALVGTSALLAPQNICVPILSAGDPPQVARAELERSRVAIEAVKDPRLAKAREACLAEVAQAQTALDRQEEQ